jgi:hypothetical protein
MHQLIVNLIVIVLLDFHDALSVTEMLSWIFALWSRNYNVVNDFVFL